MKSFIVFSNKSGDYKSVKKGWSWPAFFFGSIWALFSGLWAAALLLLPIELIFSVVGNSLDDSFQRFDSYDETSQFIIIMIVCIPLAIRLVLGAVGNLWRASKLRRLGFWRVDCVKADGKARAISLCRQANSVAASPHLKSAAVGVAETRTQSEIEQIIANANPSLAEDIRRWIVETASSFVSIKAIQKSADASRPYDTVSRHAELELPAVLRDSRNVKTILQGFPPHWLGLMIAAVSLLGVADMPYGYYQLLRLLVTGYAGYVSALYFICRQSALAWGFAFIALLYNPLFVITMSKEFHAFVNFIVAASIVWEIKNLRGMSSRPS